MLKKAVQQGRSEVRDAKNNERHACGRRRGGEPAVSRADASHSYPPTPSLPRQALFPWQYVEPLSKARTPLGDFFSILSERLRTLHSVRKNTSQDFMRRRREGPGFLRGISGDKRIHSTEFHGITSCILAHHLLSGLPTADIHSRGSPSYLSIDAALIEPEENDRQVRLAHNSRTSS
jgi:hypothetical protein